MGNLCFSNSNHSSDLRNLPSSHNFQTVRDENFSQFSIDVDVSVNEHNILARCKDSKFHDGRLGARKVAVKFNSISNLEKEYMILQNLQNSNILQFLLPPTKILKKYVLIMENFDCTLRDIISGINNEKSLMLQLAKAVDYLTDQEIIHLDIAPQNIFIVNFGLCQVVKLGNFENAQKSDEIQDVDSKNLKLTDGFIAPEILSRKTAYSASCLWSLGCVYFFIITGASGVAYKMVEITSSAEQQVDSRLILIKNSCSDKIIIKDLLKRILRQDHLDRIGAKKIIEHPFFWTPQQQLNFIVEINKLLESSEVFQNLVKEKQHKVTQKDWTEIIDKDLKIKIIEANKNHQEKNGTFKENSQNNLNGRSIKSLVSTIRNLICHAQSPEITRIVGISDESFVNYWLLKFPALIDHLYCAKERFCAQKQ